MNIPHVILYISYILTKVSSSNFVIMASLQNFLLDFSKRQPANHQNCIWSFTVTVPRNYNNVILFLHVLTGDVIFPKIKWEGHAGTKGETIDSGMLKVPKLLWHKPFFMFGFSNTSCLLIHACPDCLLSWVNYVPRTVALLSLSLVSLWLFLPRSMI